MFGNVALASPRFYCCRCHPADSTTFSPLADLFTEHTAPELLYLETRWASLISFGMTTALLKDVLPVAGTTNPETVRQHLHKIATRQDADLGTSELGLSDDGLTAGQASPVPREAVIVGIDGGYLRNWHDKRKKFEVIVGKSIVEDRDNRYFGLVRSQDAAPRRRLRAVLERQGLPVDQPVTVLTDGGDSVRALVSNLSAGSEHVLDWFHVAMRLTVLGQYAKDLTHYNGSVRFQGSLPRAPSENRFSDCILSDQENCHGLPALPLVVDHRAGGANGSWLSALPVPGVRAAVQRANWYGAQPGPGPD